MHIVSQRAKYLCFLPRIKKLHSRPLEIFHITRGTNCASFHANCRNLSICHCYRLPCSLTFGHDLRVELGSFTTEITYRMRATVHRELENFAQEGHVEWLETFKAHKHVAEMLGLVTRELPWLVTRTDPQGHKSFGVRMSRKIMCGDCTRMFGRKTWHSSTSNRMVV